MRQTSLAVLYFALPLAGSQTPPPQAVHALPRIVIRHDRPDARYLELGAKFPFVVKVGRRMGDGTLVGARWVLTAGHVADGLMRRGGESTILINDRPVRVRRAFVHPDWRPMAPVDIALLELETAVTGVDTALFNEGRDEMGQTAVLVGHGRTGNGASRERWDDDLRRGATNRIDQVNAEHLVFRFDAPPGGTELEGIPGAGDSGGPALIERNGRWYVLGVSHAGEPGEHGPGTYGALDYFVRVSSHAPWLRDVMAGRVPATEFDSARPAGTGARGVAISVSQASSSSKTP